MHRQGLAQGKGQPMAETLAASLPPSLSMVSKEREVSVCSDTWLSGTSHPGTGISTAAVGMVAGYMSLEIFTTAP